MPERPNDVPPEAWWSSSDNEWILGDKNAEGQLVGVVKYWRPDGTLVCDCPHVDGKPHGLCIRYHQSGEVSQRVQFVNGQQHGLREWFATDSETTENQFGSTMSALVRRGEVDYENGIAVAFRYFDKDDHPVGFDGMRMADRPAGVPAEASPLPSGQWVAGPRDEESKPIGLIRIWNAAGVLILEKDYTTSEASAVAYRSDGSLNYRAIFQGELLCGEAQAWRRDGTQSIRAVFNSAVSPPVASFVEHLARDGSVVRRTVYEPVSAVPAVSEPSDDDLLILDAIEEGDTEAVDASIELTPVGMARAFALGWGGGDDRDANTARLARRLVRKVAPRSLAELLARLELDLVPRLQTTARASAVVRELAIHRAIDTDALTSALIEEGGPGVMLGLSSPERVIGFLEQHIHDGKLGLSQLELTKLPSEIGRFPDLIQLDASWNHLTTVPAELGDVFCLNTLNVNHNAITSLPASLTGLPQFYTLHLGGNNLTSIPPTVFELEDLRSLGLGKNEITNLPAAIGDFIGLETLWLNDNPLHKLPNSFANLPLTFLHLGDHQFSEPPPVLAEMHSLETLWLASPSLTRLTPEVCRLPKLKELMVSYSNLSEIPDELYEATQLEQLGIEDNPLPEGTLERLKEALPNCTIY